MSVRKYLFCVCELCACGKMNRKVVDIYRKLFYQLSAEYNDTRVVFCFHFLIWVQRRLLKGKTYFVDYASDTASAVRASEKNQLTPLVRSTSSLPAQLTPNLCLGLTCIKNQLQINSCIVVTKPTISCAKVFCQFSFKEVHVADLWSHYSTFVWCSSFICGFLPWGIINNNYF